MKVQLGEFEKRDIRFQVEKILRDLGHPEPPLVLSDVRDLLSLDLHYYSTSDSGLVAELTHRFTLLRQKTIPDIRGLLQSALAKSRICAFWVPDSGQILLDNAVPQKKHRWIEAHEITHSITPWHKAFLLGDNAQTLDPTCHATLEAEANFGAGCLLFLNDQFSKEAMDHDLSFDSIKRLAKRYENSIVSTFWRVVEDRDPNQPIFGLISVHPHHRDIGKHGGPTPWRYLVRSAAFHLRFSGVDPAELFALIEKHASYRRTGPIFSSQDILRDVLGNDWEFQIESFSNGYELLTFGFPIRQRGTVVSTRHVA